MGIALHCREFHRVQQGSRGNPRFNPGNGIFDKLAGERGRFCSSKKTIIYNSIK